MSQAQSVFAAEGTPLALGNNQPFWLNDPEMVWFIQAGKVDLFAVPLQAGEPAGSRNHFLRAEAGQVLFGIAASNSGASLGFLAVGSNDSCLYRLPRPRLQELAREPTQAKDLAEWIDGWVRELYRSLSDGLPPTQFETLRAGENIELSEFASARPDDGLVWVRQTQGRSLLADKENLVLTPEIAPLPVSASVWIYALEQSSVLCLDTATLLRQNLAWPSLARFHEVVKDWAAAKVEQGVKEEGARLEAKADSQRMAVEQAVSHLSGLLATGRAKKAVTEEGGDHLLSACLLIGQSLGITIKPHPAAKKGRPQKDPLGNIAKASRVRLRRVMLTGEWWKQDNGPILGFLQETNGPVALLPTSATSYDLADPAARMRQPVTPDSAQSLNPLAYTFYRPFSDRALKVWEVFKFGLHNTRSDILMVLFMGVIGGMLGMLTPIVTGLIFDSVIPSADGGQLKFLTLALLVGAFASVIFHVTRSIALLRVEAKSDASIQGAVWDRLLSLPLPFFRQYTSGDLAMRANGISAIREILSGAVLTSVLGGVFSVFNFGLLFFYSPKLALVATLLVVLNVVSTTFVSFFSLQFQRPLYEIQGKISGQVLQFITGISKLRVAGAEMHAYAVWAKGFSAQKSLDLRTGTIFIGLSVFNEIYPVLTSICLFGAMAFWAEPGMTTGKFLAFSAAFMTFLYAMLDMSGALISILHTVPIYERAKPILMSLPEVSEVKSDPGELSGRIELSHVSFRYKQDGPLIVRDVSFQINPGEFVAIVGPSGSGKSTLFRLLLGFENPESGTIYYDGLDLAGLDVQAVRRQFGVVMQNGKLMPGDIYQNIVGSSLLTLDDAWEAARKAGFDEEIKQMPMGMHTVLSEGAGTLSGGQRQRLMIARAIVAKPRILLFDEATSALDNRTQAIVSKSLEQLQATRIVIAHRLSTIINADRIFVMQGGRLLQTGNYAELIKQTGPFSELARRQLA